MHRKWLRLLGCCCLLQGACAFANGGGYDINYERSTGSLAPFQASGTKDIRIVDEKLDITFRRTEALVVVRYRMRNTTNNPVLTTFGFPVESRFPYPEQVKDFMPDDGQEQGHTDELREAGVLKPARQALKRYLVISGGDMVEARYEEEPFATGKVKPFPGSAALRDIAGWMVSQVAFNPTELKEIEISYALDYDGGTWGVSDAALMDTGLFRYRLSTGGIWNGPIETGTITLRVDGIPAEEVEILKPRERFQRKGDQWVWTFRDLEPTLKDDLAIAPVPDCAYEHGTEYSDEKGFARSFIHRLGKWGELTSDYRATASSTLPPQGGKSYGPGNVKGAKGPWAGPWGEGERTPPWAEGVPGPGLGESLTILPGKARPLMALEVQAGYVTGRYEGDEKPLFQRNGRPSRLEIVLNDEHRFVATLGDRPSAQLIPIVGYSKPVTKLTMIIRDVYPGSMYSDTCISYVGLYVPLKGRPEIYHER